MYIVYCRIGAVVLPLNSWGQYYDAFREAESLNKADYKCYYFIRYKENFNGKDINL